MKLLFFKIQFSLSDYEYFIEIIHVLLKTLLNLFYALFPLLIGFFKFNKTEIDKESLIEEDYYDAIPENVDFDEIEKPFSSLSFRFQTYDEFLKNAVNFDSSVISNDFVEESFYSFSNSDPENSPSNDLDLIDDIIIEIDDEVDDIFDAITEKVEDDDFIKELQIEMMFRTKAKFESVLSSIPEESDCPIPSSEDLKPLKKEKSFDHEEITKEIQKFHNLYAEKMRKYDILNRQTTYRKELKKMKSKGFVDSVSSKGLCGCKHEKKCEVKTGENRGIERDLELVYVVQLCTSWEFIVWQYKKSLEICGRDDYGSCRFNEVADKFQQFKVMIQRFMENESFDKGSRFECYAITRLLRRKLLQVPLIKADDDDNDDDEGAVQIDRLLEIMQESIRILWQFIQADKLAHISTLKCNIKAEQECTSPGSSKILKQILMQKERKLKKIIKKRNCTLKNCKDSLEEDEPNDELYFLAMVDLKLVSRVLNMKSIKRDQLNWCHNKLSSISFSNGKIKTEPSLVFFHSNS